jgi:hypothetical protein
VPEGNPFFPGRASAHSSGCRALAAGWDRAAWRIEYRAGESRDRSSRWLRRTPRCRTGRAGRNGGSERLTPQREMEIPRVFDALPMPQSFARDGRDGAYEPACHADRRTLDGSRGGGGPPAQTWLLAVWNDGPTSRCFPRPPSVRRRCVADTLRAWPARRTRPVSNVRFPPMKASASPPYEQNRGSEKDAELHARACRGARGACWDTALTSSGEELRGSLGGAEEPERARRAYLAGARRARQRISPRRSGAALQEATLRLSTKPNSEASRPE